MEKVTDVECTNYNGTDYVVIMEDSLGSEIGVTDKDQIIWFKKKDLDKLIEELKEFREELGE